MAKSQMYDWVKTVNPLAGSSSENDGGHCLHNCRYCYMRPLIQRFPHIREKYSGSLRIDKKGMDNIKGSGNTFFLCSSTDLLAENVPGKLIHRILRRCWEYPDNTYLFQTKNNVRFFEFLPYFPPVSILAVTIEGMHPDVEYLSAAPRPQRRMQELCRLMPLLKDSECSLRTMVSIEPVSSLGVGFYQLEKIGIDIVSIGANTGRMQIPEPSSKQLLEFIDYVRQAITPDVRLKHNLSRILGKEKLAEVIANGNSDAQLVK